MPPRHLPPPTPSFGLQKNADVPTLRMGYDDVRTQNWACTSQHYNFLCAPERRYIPKALNNLFCRCRSTDEGLLLRTRDVLTLHRHRHHFLFTYHMNIYLGNLNYRVQEEDLQKRLEEYGTVDSVRVIKDRETGRSRGYAFAEMPNDDEANQAIAELNDQTFEGRRLVAKVALPRP